MNLNVLMERYQADPRIFSIADRITMSAPQRLFLKNLQGSAPLQQGQGAGLSLYDIGQLGGEPQSVAALPLVVRGKVVAVLYADAVSTDPNAINLDALELLARVAGMAVGLISGPRPAPEAQVSESETASVAPPAVAEAEAVPEAVEAEHAYEPESSYEPEVEPQAAEVIAESQFDVVHEVAAERCGIGLHRQVAAIDSRGHGQGCGGHDVLLLRSAGVVQ